jgi:hypothetical protein
MCLDGIRSLYHCHRLVLHKHFPLHKIFPPHSPYCHYFSLLERLYTKRALPIVRIGVIGFGGLSGLGVLISWVVLWRIRGEGEI